MSIEHPSFGKLDDDRVIIFDTTLRDGAQTTGVDFSLEDKRQVAGMLDRMVALLGPTGG